MFSGIVKSIGEVSELVQSARGAKLAVRASAGLDADGEIQIGESISVNGVCLTIVGVGESVSDGVILEFDLGSETMRATNLGELVAGSEVNLERALAYGERVSGHLVQGHVDMRTSLVAMASEGETKRMSFKLPNRIAKYITPKGGVCLDGVSLTVGEVTSEQEFSVYVIPHTYSNTAMRNWKVGTEVNVEVDLIARYVESALSFR